LVIKDMFIKGKDEVPVIFIPGLFGSMGDDIIPGTGKWHFGISACVYDPFIRILEKIGYKLDRTLFISFYDWRKSCDYSANEYLLETIKYVKTKTKRSKVDLICHSMGGLIARAYVQSDLYDYDVDKMFFFGTPNAGAASAYYFLASRDVLKDRYAEDSDLELFIEGYLWLFGKLLNKEEVQVSQDQFMGIKDLLPNKRYGNYLFRDQKDGSMIFETYSRMKCKNEFLDRLDRHKERIEAGKIDVTIVGGTGEETVKYLETEPWESDEFCADGRVVGQKKSRDGDGVVMLESAFSVAGDKYTIHDSHSNILLRSEYILRRKLLGNYKLKTTASLKKDRYLQDFINLLIDGTGKILLMEDKGKQWVEIDENASISSGYLYYESFSKNLKWLLLKGNKLKKIKIKYISTKDQIVKLQISSYKSARKRKDAYMKRGNEMEVI